MFEDIKELELASLDVGHTATPTNKRAVVTSLILRFVKKKKKLDPGPIGSSPRNSIELLSHYLSSECMISIIILFECSLSAL